MYAQNAAAADFQLGSRCISDPDCLRMLLGVYERVARESAGPIGLVAARRGQRYGQHFDPRGFVAQLSEHVWQVVTADSAAAPRVTGAPASGR